jgi:hypothetical protein
MPQNKNFYEILDVARDDTEQDIRRSYYRLALKFHPDKVAPSERDEAAEKFIEINDAYEVLRDKARRAAYDISLRPQGTQYSAQMPEYAARTEQSSATPSTQYEGTQYSAQMPEYAPRTEQSSATSYIDDLLRQIATAVMQRDEALLSQLCDTYLRTRTYVLPGHKSTLNWLLRYCAENKLNNMAMVLINAGADPNHFAELFKFRRLNSSCYDNFVVLECYFVDMLAFWDNIELLQRIGTAAINWQIYNVTNSTPHNAANRFINLHQIHWSPTGIEPRFSVNNIRPRTLHNQEGFNSENEYKEAMDQLLSDFAIRLKWLNILCYRLAKANDVTTLEFLYNKMVSYNICSELNSNTIGFDAFRNPIWYGPAIFVDVDPISRIFYSRTYAKNTIKHYLDFVNSPNSTYNWMRYKVQLFLDKHLNFHLSVLANRQFKMEKLAQFSSAINIDNQRAVQQLIEYLDFYYIYQNWISVALMLGGAGVPLLGTGLDRLVNHNENTPGIYSMIAIGALLSIEIAIVAVLQVIAILFRVLSAANLEVNGNINDVSLRALRSLLLCDLYNPMPERAQQLSRKEQPEIIFAFNMRSKPTQTSSSLWKHTIESGYNIFTCNSPVGPVNQISISMVTYRNNHRTIGLCINDRSTIEEIRPVYASLREDGDDAIEESLDLIDCIAICIRGCARTLGCTIRPLSSTLILEKPTKYLLRLG